MPMASAVRTLVHFILIAVPQINRLTRLWVPLRYHHTWFEKLGQ